MSLQTLLEMPVDSDALEHYRQELSLPDVFMAVNALAHALAVELSQQKTFDGVVVFRRGMTSIYALSINSTSHNAEIERMAPQINTLNKIAQHLRYISYHQAEQDCEKLAASLCGHFGRRELAKFRFVAIPRGGLIVLGMLTYILNLKAAQLELPHSPDVPMVVVDDCALTGFRFGQFLQRHQSNQIIFAPLYSHPDLRAAIVDREPHVVTCLSAQDLHDYGPEHRGEAYLAWRTQKLTQMEEERYWIGQTEHLCFPWNEPDRLVFNPTTGKLEPGWRIVPPELCLKNRLPPGAKPIPVQVQPEGKGPLKPSEQVVFGDLGDEIVVGDLESQKTFGLRDSAADMWRAIVEYGNLEDAAIALLRLYDVAEATLREDLRTFADNLLTRRLLTLDPS